MNKLKYLDSLFNRMMECHELFVEHQKTIIELLTTINKYLDNCEAGRRKGK